MSNPLMNDAPSILISAYVPDGAIYVIGQQSRITMKTNWANKVEHTGEFQIRVCIQLEPQYKPILLHREWRKNLIKAWQEGNRLC